MHLWKSTRLTTPPCYLPLKFFTKKSDKIFFAQDPLYMDRRSIILTTEGFIKRYKTFLPDAMPVQIEYAAELYELITHDKDTSTVTVSNGRCGLGKSTFVKSLINYYLVNDDGRFRGKAAIGMVIVTDMIRRAHEYLGYDHDKYCAFITAKDENPYDIPATVQLSLAKNKPVIIVTTQRFFNMDNSDREELFRYKLDGDSEWRKRSITIIDEKPYFFSTVKLCINNFSRCDAALRCLPKDHPDKDWLISEFKPFRDKMFELLRAKERAKARSNQDIFYWSDAHTSNLTSDDEQFFKLLQAPKVRKCLLNEYPDLFRDMDSFKRLMTGGAFFIAVKPEASPKQRDETYFLLLQDNRHMFYLGENKAKFIILDGTSDLDTDYRVDYVQLIDASAHNTNLALTINLNDVPASKSAIVNGDRSAVEEQRALLEQDVMAHIDNLHDNHTLIVTYKSIEDTFLADKCTAPAITKGHFGGLRGLNELRNISNMVIVGFNRKSAFDYYIQYVAQHPEELAELRTMGENKSRSHISQKLKQDKGVFVTQELNQIMFCDLLSDFEQNIFRTSIRNYDNTQPVTVNAYWNCTAYDRLNRMIEERYSSYGAQIIDLGKPAIFEEHKTKTRKASGGKANTNPQKVIEWANQQPLDRIFTIAELRKEVGLDAKEFKSTKQNKAVKSLLNKWRTDIDGTYKVS